MGAKTSINWTESSVNPLLARLREPLEIHGREPLPAGKLGFHCIKISAECAHCYASTFNQRGLPARGTGLNFTAPNGEKVEMILDRAALDAVLRWQRPRRIFWCSMTDLFGEFVLSEMIQECLDVAAAAGEKRGHVSQLLTKRPERMLVELRTWRERHGRPLPSQIWPGFSAGDRKLFTPRWEAARQIHAEGLVEGPLWCSYEPAVGPLVLPAYSEVDAWQEIYRDGLRWIVWGGESGAKARPFNVAWAQAAATILPLAGIDVWGKQLGARPFCEMEPVDVDKGDHGELLAVFRKHVRVEGYGSVVGDFGPKGDKFWEEWPEWFRLREFPEGLRAI